MTQATPHHLQGTGIIKPNVVPFSRGPLLAVRPVRQCSRLQLNSADSAPRPQLIGSNVGGEMKVPLALDSIQIQRRWRWKIVVTISARSAQTAKKQRADDRNGKDEHPAQTSRKPSFLTPQLDGTHCSGSFGKDDDRKHRHIVRHVSHPNGLALRRGPLLAVAWSGWCGRYTSARRTLREHVPVTASPATSLLLATRQM